MHSQIIPTGAPWRVCAALAVALGCLTLMPSVQAQTTEPAASTEQSIDVIYGEPVQLKGHHIYFTSWKYVRPGAFRWEMPPDPATAEGDQQTGAWLQGDTSRPARFRVFDMPRGVRLEAQKAEKIPLPEGQLAAQVYDNGKYKTWYTQGPDSRPDPTTGKDKILPGYNHYVCYAESDDGTSWTRPSLGLFEYDGSRDNNIVFRGDMNGSTRGWHGGSVFIDPSSTEERYKMIYLGMVTDEEWDAFSKKYPGELDTMARRQPVGGFRLVNAVFGAVSPDGIHWTSLPEPLMIQHADTLNTCYYDLDRKMYIAYVRSWLVDPTAPEYVGQYTDSWLNTGRRAIGRSLSRDFRHFSKPEICVAPGADMPGTHVFYSNSKTTLPDAPDNHVMFPWIWEIERDGGSVHLMSSPDGWNWSRVPGGPVIEPGKLGTGDGGHVGANIHLLEYPDGKWAIPYGGSVIPHKYPGRDVTKRKGLFPGVKSAGGLATWPKGRLVALVCDEEGEFATVGVVPPGDTIRLNAIVPPTGHIKVAVRQLGSGEDLPDRGFEDMDPIVGDELAFPVTWKGDSALNHGGKPIILRFQLRQAKLFGIEFK